MSQVEVAGVKLETTAEERAQYSCAVGIVAQSKFEQRLLRDFDKLLARLSPAVGVEGLVAEIDELAGKATARPWHDSPKNGEIDADFVILDHAGHAVAIVNSRDTLASIVALANAWSKIATALRSLAAERDEWKDAALTGDDRQNGEPERWEDRYVVVAAAWENERKRAAALAERLSRELDEARTTIEQARLLSEQQLAFADGLVHRNAAAEAEALSAARREEREAIARIADERGQWILNNVMRYGYEADLWRDIASAIRSPDGRGKP